MADETISEAVSERYARAAASGEQSASRVGITLTTSARSFPDEVLKISYGCGTPVGLETVRVGETVTFINRASGEVIRTQVSCDPNGTCC